MGSVVCPCRRQLRWSSGTAAMTVGDWPTVPLTTPTCWPVHRCTQKPLFDARRIKQEECDGDRHSTLVYAWFPPLSGGPHATRLQTDSQAYYHHTTRSAAPRSHTLQKRVCSASQRQRSFRKSQTEEAGRKAPPWTFPEGQTHEPHRNITGVQSASARRRHCPLPSLASQEHRQ